MENKKEKTAAEQLKEKLFYKPENGTKKLSVEEIAAADAYCEGYKAFLDKAKTECEAVSEVIAMAKKEGFVYAGVHLF